MMEEVIGFHANNLVGALLVTSDRPFKPSIFKDVSEPEAICSCNDHLPDTFIYL
jgi:hypothetical protein